MSWGSLEVLVGVIAAAIAITALFLQRYEIIKNGRMNALIYASTLVQQRIDYYDNLIKSMERDNNNANTYGIKKRINEELRPLKQKIDFELLDLMGRHEGVAQVPDIKSALQSKNTPKDTQA